MVLMLMMMMLIVMLMMIAMMQLLCVGRGHLGGRLGVPRVWLEVPSADSRGIKEVSIAGGAKCWQRGGGAYTPQFRVAGLAFYPSADGRGLIFGQHQKHKSN